MEQITNFITTVSHFYIIFMPMDKIKTDIDRLFLEASQRGRDMTKTKLILMELLDRGYHVEEELGRLESDRKRSGDKNDLDFRLNWDEGDE